MKKQWKRLLIAASISASVFAFTWYWYHHSQQKISVDHNEKPLAYIGKVTDDIQRRPATRLLWQLVSTGEPLYNGEAIRTSDLGEVRIQFADSDRYLDLEPDSLIVIKKSEGEIALDLMEGSLFVNAATSTEETTGLVLNSASGKVDLSKASASLSKSEGKDVEVQVVKGKASVQTSDGVGKALTTTSTFKILSPSMQKPTYVNGEDILPVLFQWEGVSPEGETEIWFGTSRKNMKKVATVAIGQNKAEIELKIGKHFWKLVTHEGPQQRNESPVYRLEVLPLYPPTVTYPTAEAIIPSYNETSDVTFRWQKDEASKKVHLTVARDSGFQEVVVSPSVTFEDSYTIKHIAPGTYYWKIASEFPQADQLVFGKVQKFTITPAEQMRAQLASTLKVEFQILEQKQQFVDEPKILLNWTSDTHEGVKGWRLRLREENQQSQNEQVFEVQDLKFTAVVPSAGRYIASVEALNSQGYVIGSSISKPIDLQMKPLPEPPQFLPADGNLLAEADGRIQLQWTLIPAVQEYRLKIYKNGQELRSTSYKTTQAALKNLLPGRYDVELTSVDLHGRSSERLERRQLIVPELSNLRAPAVRGIKVD